MRRRLACTLAVLAVLPAAAHAAPGPAVRFQTSLGNIDVLLLPDDAPNTVKNFLTYVDEHAYDASFVHRSQAKFVIQGGGYKYDGATTTTIPARAPIKNEFKDSNQRGTLAMAKTLGKPNSATSQWFFNERNNPSLNTQNGGYTVFGRILDPASRSVMDQIGALPILDRGSPFNQLPVRDYLSGPVTNDNLVNVISVTRLPDYYIPFSLDKTAVKAKVKHGGKVTATVTDLPVRTKVFATLTAGKRAFADTARAPKSGTAKLSFTLPRKVRHKRLTLHVTATPPGGTAASVTKAL